MYVPKKSKSKHSTYIDPAEPVLKVLDKCFDIQWYTLGPIKAGLPRAPQRASMNVVKDVLVLTVRGTTSRQLFQLHVDLLQWDSVIDVLEEHFQKNTMIFHDRR